MIKNKVYNIRAYYNRKKNKMEITTYAKPFPGMDIKNYLENQMYDIYGGGEITYIDDHPSHFKNGSLKIDGNLILFNYMTSIGRTWSWDYSGYTIDMWIKPISCDGLLISVASGHGSRFYANYGGENWGEWNCSLENINMKGVPLNQWNRITICSDEDNKKLYAFVNGELQFTISGETWKTPKFYIGGNDTWAGGGYCQAYLGEIYVTPKVRFTKNFDPYKNWIYFHTIYANPDAYEIPKKDGEN